MVIIILLVLGVCLGSFVNAFVWRFHEKAELADIAAGRQTAEKLSKNSAAKRLTAQELSITKGRSMCVHCHHPLAAKDLIPVVSYLSLKGKCRYCRKPIQDTPLAELATPLLFVVSYIFWPFSLSGGGLLTFCFWLFFVVGFVALSLYDIRWFELPHAIVLPLTAVAALQSVLLATVFDGGWHSVIRSVSGLLIGGGLFFVLYAVSPKETLEDGSKISRWIGGGDITLGALLGLIVGGPAPAVLLIFIASLLGTLVALPLIALGRAQRTSHLPFGPYLMLSAVIVMLWGGRLIDLYTKLFMV